MGSNPLHLKSLNHISIVCRSVERSLEFYQNVLGFFPIRRPNSFEFDGAWLFNYGIGIHLLQSEDPENMPKINQINPKDNHISFQARIQTYGFKGICPSGYLPCPSWTNFDCESMAAVEKKLKEMGIEYIESTVEEGGIFVDQLFFHDPDGMMIEICNCDNLPVVPLAAGEPLRTCSRITCSLRQHQLRSIV